MSEVNASIPLSAGQGVTPIMSPFQAAQGAMTLQQLMQQSQLGQQKLQQNQSNLALQANLARLAGTPGMIDPETRLPSPQMIGEIMKINPDAGEKLNQIRLQGLSTKAEADLRKSETAQKSNALKQQTMLDIREETLSQYEEDIKNGIDPKAALNNYMTHQGELIKKAKETGSGGITSNDNIPLLDPVAARTKVLGYKGAQDEENKKKAQETADSTPIMKEAAALYGKDSQQYRDLLKKDLEQKTSGDDSKKAPSGFRYMADGNLEFIPGGPADPAKKEGKLGARESVFINRTMLSANEAAKDLENVVKLPLASSTGWMGGRQQSTSIFGATKEVLANKLTPQEVQSYNTLSAGFQRSLAAIEAAGLAPSGTLSHQMDSVIFKEGDTNLTKLQKLAQTRQIIEAGLETTLANPRLPDAGRDHIDSILKSIKKSVPFSQSDLIDLENRQSENPDVTLQDVIKEKAKAIEKEKPAVKSLQGNDAANKIKADYQSGKLTRDQAKAELAKLSQ